MQNGILGLLNHHIRCYWYNLCKFNCPDVIMDMLGGEEERMAILNYYQESDEPQAVENAIEEVCNSVDEGHIQQR